jgi:hypothetical protein
LRIDSLALVLGRGLYTPRPPSLSTKQFCAPLFASTHRSHPDSRGGGFDECEIVGVVFFETCGDRHEMLELVEEALDKIAETIGVRAEGRDIDAPGHRLDVGPCAASSEGLTQGVA